MNTGVFDPFLADGPAAAARLVVLRDDPRARPDAAAGLLLADAAVFLLAADLLAAVARPPREPREFDAVWFSFSLASPSSSLSLSFNENGTVLVELDLRFESTFWISLYTCSPVKLNSTNASSISVSSGNFSLRNLQAAFIDKL